MEKVSIQIVFLCILIIVFVKDKYDIYQAKKKKEQIVRTILNFCGLGYLIAVPSIFVAIEHREFKEELFRHIRHLVNNKPRTNTPSDNVR
jgi:hypothetical protein